MTWISSFLLLIGIGSKISLQLLHQRSFNRHPVHALKASWFCQWSRAGGLKLRCLVLQPLSVFVPWVGLSSSNSSEIQSQNMEWCTTISHKTTRALLRGKKFNSPYSNAHINLPMSVIKYWNRSSIPSTKNDKSLDSDLKSSFNSRIKQFVTIASHNAMYILYPSKSINSTMKSSTKIKSANLPFKKSAPAL